MKKFQQRYVKYLIKNPILFYAFTILLLIVFIKLSLSIELDIVESYPANIDYNIISVEEINSESLLGSKVYYYINRNEKIYKSEVIDVFSDGGRLDIVITGNEQGVVCGAIGIDLIVGRQTLLEQIFMKVGKKNEAKTVCQFK